MYQFSDSSRSYLLRDTAEESEGAAFVARVLFELGVYREDSLQESDTVEP